MVRDAAFRVREGGDAGQWPLRRHSAVRTMRMRTPVLLAAEVIDWVSVATGVVLKATHGHKAGLRLPDRDLVITRLNRRG